jgi:hypothetical protein
MWVGILRFHEQQILQHCTVYLKVKDRSLRESFTTGVYQQCPKMVTKNRKWFGREIFTLLDLSSSRSADYCYRLFVCLYLCTGFNRPRNSHQGRVTAITEVTGNCTFEASSLLQSTTHLPLSTNWIIYSDAKYYNFLRKQGVIWPFNIIRL